MNFKNFIKKNKKMTIWLVVALVLGLASGSSNVPEAEYNNLLVQKEQLDNEIVLLDTQLEESKKQVSELQTKKEEADRLAKEEAERIAKEKEEAERLAKEEAYRLAKEEAERIAQEEAARIAYDQQHSHGYEYHEEYYATESVQEVTPIGQMVWLSETGSKYHSISHCGRMNPDRARQVTIDEAISGGFGPCSKCY